MGDAQVALAQIHSLLVEESCGGESQDGCLVWWGLHGPGHAQHVPNDRRTNQNHLLSLSLTFSFDALPAARFFTPGTMLILPSTHELPELRVQLAGHHGNSDFCLRKQRTILPRTVF